jgi:hypothetical protein
MTIAIIVVTKVKSTARLPPSKSLAFASQREGAAGECVYVCPRRCDPLHENVDILSGGRNFFHVPRAPVVDFCIAWLWISLSLSLLAGLSRGGRFQWCEDLGGGGWVNVRTASRPVLFSHEFFRERKFDVVGRRSPRPKFSI